MRRRSIARISQVTVALIVLGAIIGGLLGAGLVALLGVRIGEFRVDQQILFIGAQFGAATGAVLAPLAAWTFMRRVPIWRAIAETAAGTVLGTLIGLVFQPLYNTAWLSPPLLGTAGFILAAIRLWLANRAGSRSHFDAQAD